MKNNYNVRALLDMAQEYLNAENEYRTFCLTFKGGWVPNLEPSEYGDYIRKEAASTYTWRALKSACEVISADVDAVVATAKEAGTGCFIGNCYGSRQFVFGPNSRAQANARSRNAEAMTRALRSMGYDAMDYCQMD